jgi:LmbE family N-acetylglucosaminyl deacetylase
MKKDAYFFLGHIDDFEISCLGYLFKNHSQYKDINILIATSWELKKNIWNSNIAMIQDYLNRNIKYVNFNYQQRSLNKNFDNLKDDFYKLVNFKNRFDIITHDQNDCHTDHVVCHNISMGLFKYTNRFTTIYSPSSRNFQANYWTGLTESQFVIKKKCIDKYNIDNEQSYTKLGYYMQNDSHYNIGRAYYIESFAHSDFDYYETYRILKSVE